MKFYLYRLFLLFAFAPFLYGVVGDWVSYGSRLDMAHLHVNGKAIYAASPGGLLRFDMDTEQFTATTNTDFLEHIDLLTYFVNEDGSQWFSYGSGMKGITVVHADGSGSFFDFGFQDVSAFTGNDEHVFAVYKDDFTPKIAHFVKRNNRYIFQDTYNQFPSGPQKLYDISVIDDSIYVASDRGLISAYLYDANLKPVNAWNISLPEDSVSILRLTAFGDSLFFANELNEVFLYFNGTSEKILDGQYPPLTFFNDGSHLYYASEKRVHNIISEEEIYNSPDELKGFCVLNDTLWVARANKGITRIDPQNDETTSYIPNSMLHMRSNALAITPDRKLAVCGLSGISILEGNYWHNLVFSHQNESIYEDRHQESFSADTLNIAYRIGGETAVYDALVSSSGELFCSITDISVAPVSGQSEEARGPGPFQRIDLNDLYNYHVYDTSAGTFQGTQELGGSAGYIKMRGLQEDSYGNIWVLNAHTIDAEPLINFRSDGTIRKFSVEESGNTLQILAREMVFDRYGRLWIANQARQSDIPRTTGGITVFDPNTGIWALITSSDGLISNDVNSIDADPLTGNIWVATASGVQMIRTPSVLNASTDFSLNPPLDGLSGIIPKKIRIDPKGNKWILTQSQGVQIYLSNNRWFNEGNGLTRANSGLLDNVVYDLVFDTFRGYAYLLTASGLNRYDIPWTEERDNLDNVTVFPQPFRPGTDTYLAVDGLAEQSEVKISTIDGRVVKMFRINATENKGKQIVWDGRLDNGQYIPRGVYLLFISNVGGLKTTAKIAVE